MTGERTRGGLLQGSRRRRAVHRARPRLRAVRGPRLVRDVDAGHRARRASSPRAIHAEFPGKLLAYNCSPSFNWQKHLDDDDDRELPVRARRDGLQVPVHHPGGLPRAELLDVRAGARLRGRGHAGILAAPAARVRAEADGYTATRHQREVGAGYFDQVAQAISGGESSTLALKGSTEEAQFEGAKAPA